MRSSLLLFFLSCLFQANIQAQSTALDVYAVLQNKCASCHSNADPAAGLDLEGSGSSLQAKALKVYQNVVNVTPSNTYAASKGYKHIYPGRVDKSSLFRLIQGDFENSIELNSAEGDHTETGASELTNEEKELFRQWIGYGAPSGGTVVDLDLIDDYYSGNGIPSFPEKPAAPDPSEGFQIKMASFLLEPDGEKEFFQKYELDLPEDVEVKRIDMKISNYSHHLIVYDFTNGGDQFIPAGLRLDPDHSNIGLVTAIQEATDLRLPEKTAFRWDNNIVLDLNSHYINYSATTTYLAEVYINVYTQPIGTAEQEMHSELLVNFDIYIPNNGNPVTHEQTLNYNLGDIYLWGMMGHTHQYGTGYKVYKREAGQQTDLIYDASCAQGNPGCVSPYFDYQHIPIRYFDNFEPISMNFLNGMVHEASWVNDGPSNVWFGPTSDDEMMVLVIMYVESLEGLTTNTEEILLEDWNGVRVFPNPMNEQTIFEFDRGLENSTIRIFDMLGREVRSLEQGTASGIVMQRDDLQKGFYVFHVEDEQGRLKTGKLVVE